MTTKARSALIDANTASRIFGRGLRDLRKDSDYSIKEISAKSGLSRGLLSNIETGKGNPTIETIEKLGVAYGSKNLADLVAEIWRRGSFQLQLNIK